MGNPRHIAKITSVRINEGFHTGYYNPFSGSWVGGSGYHKETRQGTRGYKISQLPVGTELNTDAKWVVVMGPNGCGKTTLLQKMEYQLRFTNKHESFLDIEYQETQRTPDEEFYEISKGPPKLKIVTRTGKRERKLLSTYSPRSFVDELVQWRAELSHGQ